MTTGRKGAEINVTPMIDILLVLLVIFMVVTPQLSTGLDTTLPQLAPESAKQDNTALVLRIDAGGNVKLNDESVERAGLAARLAQIFQVRGNQSPLFLQADGSLEFQEVAQVIDIARGAGAGRIAIMGRK